MTEPRSAGSGSGRDATAMTGSHPAPGEGLDDQPSWWASLAFSTDSVYGLIIVAGMLVVSTNLTVTSGEALLSVATTLLVFFAAHVYAATVSYLAARETRGARLGQALAHGVRESAGLLVAGAIPVVMLALGLIGVVQDAEAVWLALGVDVLLLGVLGWFIAAARTRSIWIRLSSLLLMAAFGMVLILLKAAVSH